MSSRQIFHDAINHKNPDRIPIDFGSTVTTGMHVSCVEKLREYYGLEKKPVKVIDPFQMLGLVDEDLRECIGIDTIKVGIGNTQFGFRNENWKEWEAPWGQTVLVPEKFRTTVDENGDYLIYPQGDVSAPASAKMTEEGYFFDAIMRQEEIDDDNLNPEDNVEEYSLITDEELELWKNEINKIEDTDQARIGNLGGTGLGDIALVPGVGLKNPKGIRDISEWYMSIISRPDYIHEVFSRQTEIALKNFEKLAPIIGDNLDAVFICGTDFGTQNSMFCSLDTFRSLWMPYYKKINNWIHQNTNWKTIKHCCGSIKKLIPLLIESGFDCLNPVQISAENMDPKELKEEFGEDIVFWGGGVDTQETLPSGTPQEVKKEVLKNCEIFSEGGGFIFSSIHNVQATAPLENIVAMIEAVNEFNGS